MSRETDVVTAVFVGGPLDGSFRTLRIPLLVFRAKVTTEIGDNLYDLRYDILDVNYMLVNMVALENVVVYRYEKLSEMQALKQLIGAYRKVYAFEADDLIMSTAAYYLGRKTIQCHAFCDKLIESWDELPENVRQFVKRIVENAFHRGGDALGSDVDLRVWERVRKCWKEKP